MTSRKIKFITDSTADIPDHLVEKWDITVVPTFVNIGDQSFADDGVQLDREDYYNQLRTLDPIPTTSAPSPGYAAELVAKAFEGADHLVIITLPKKLSGTFEAIRYGVEQLPPNSATMIESGTLSMAMGYQVLVGAQVAQDTDGDLDAVVDAVQRVKDTFQLAALLEVLDHVRRSGRVNPIVTGIGNLLQIKPILTVRDGEVTNLARVRTVSKAKQELVRIARAQAPLESITFIHTNNLEGVEWLRNELADILPDEVFVVRANTSLGTHIGPGVIAFATLTSKWRQ